MTNTTSPAAATPTPDIARTQGARPAHRWPRLWGRRMWLLLALAAVLLVYRTAVVHYSGISLFFDEAQYWDWSRELQWGYFSKPPVIAGLIAAGTAVFGNGVLGVKIMPMLTYVATAVAMVGLARALWPTSSGVRTGIVAGALFLTSPMTGLLGMFASTDGPLLLCWTLAAWALWRAQVTNRLGLWLLCGVVCGVGMLSKYTMAAFAITALWALWGVHGPKRGLLRLGPWVAIAAALAVLAPNVLWNAEWGFPTLQHTADITTKSSRSGGPVAALVFLVGQIAMLGPVAVIAGLWLHRRVHTGTNEVAGQSQWAASSQMLPPSQWAASTQVASSSQPASSQLSQPEQARTKSTRNSAYYLASVTSYRYLVALSAPLLLIAVAQAFRAGAHVNWAAPAMISLLLLLATRLSLPLVPLSAPRPQAWFWLVLASNLILTGIVLHARDVMGDKLPAKADVLVRMRGWDAAFGQLDPLLNDPRVQGLPIVADKRLLLAQAAYQWRSHQPRIMAWNPTGAHGDHYQLQRSMPNTVGQDVLLLTDAPDPDYILNRFAFKRELGRSMVQVGPGRQITLYLYLARGFVGYDNKTYTQQSGTANERSEDIPFTEQPQGGPSN
ncbi:MAG: glycosyltransferase family 39 protein [Aquabacterium sp.]|jgi:4-amino-4-deoxy-L-arabinose transferase-like glycosyltransferase|uniref:ArnT family glycosyltransferase n=1 Tax=Aquabacterium sp. TaxID=1872578 RepID=UPI003BB1A3B7